MPTTKKTTRNSTQSLLSRITWKRWCGKISCGYKEIFRKAFASFFFFLYIFVSLVPGNFFFGQKKMHKQNSPIQNFGNNFSNFGNEPDLKFSILFSFFFFQNNVVHFCVTHDSNVFILHDNRKRSETAAPGCRQPRIRKIPKLRRLTLQ